MSGPNDIPFGDEDHGFKEEKQHRGQDHPAVVDVFPNLLVEPGKIPVRIPGRERYMRHVEAGAALHAAASLRRELFVHGNIFFLRILVPEAALVHIFGEGPHLLGGNRDPCLGLERSGNLLVRTHSVEEAGELPLRRLQA